jgi:ribose 5-phosphate isomerase B
MPKTIITVDDIRTAQPGSVLPVPPGAIITDLAREVAQAHGISLVASDHSVSLGYTVLDCGTYTPDAVDYPDIAYAVAKQVANSAVWRGIIIDGAGIGSCMAANKVPGIRAALCYNEAMARNSREHNDANILTMGAGMIGLNLAKQIVATWLNTAFGGGRHQRRVNKIVEIEQRFLKG